MSQEKMTPEEEAAFMKKWGAYGEAKPPAKPEPPKEEQLKKQSIWSRLLRGKQLEQQQKESGL